MRILIAAAAAMVMLVGDAPVAEANSCARWYYTCFQRGGANVCDQKLRVCKRSGCWTESNLYGGRRHCGLRRT